MKNNVLVDFSVFAKGIKGSYALCEPIQNAVSSIKANKQTDADLLIEVIEKNGQMTVAIKDNGLGIRKSKISNMMNIGKSHSSKATNLNENGSGLKGYVAFNDPTEQGWNIRVRDTTGAMFRISGPWMNYSVEDIADWQDGEYNFVIETPVTEEDAKEFYRHITADYIRWQFLFEDCIGWKLVKDINGEIERYNIPAFNFDSNPAVTRDEGSFLKKKYAFDEHCGVYLTMQFYNVKCVASKDCETPTLKKEQIHSMEPDVLLFGIQNYAGQSIANIAREKTALLRNLETQGIYLYQNGRFNSRQTFEFIDKTSHNKLNGRFIMVNVETYGGLVFPSDVNKRGIDTQKEVGVFLQTIISQEARRWFTSQRKANSERRQRKTVDIGLDIHARLFGGNYQTEVLVDDSKLRMDAVYKSDGTIGIIEYKAEPISANHISQVRGYFQEVVTNIRKECGGLVAFNASPKSLPSVIIFGAPQNFKEGNSFIKKEAISAIENWKQDIAEIYPNKEFKISCLNLLEYTNNEED